MPYKTRAYVPDPRFVGPARPLGPTPFVRLPSGRNPFGTRPPGRSGGLPPRFPWGRFLPWVGVAVELWIAYEAYQQFPPRWDGGGNWVLYHNCGTGFSDHYDAPFSEYFPAYNCFGNQIMGPATDMGAASFPPALVHAGAETLIVGHGHVLFGDAFWALDNNLWFDKIGGFGEAVPPPVLRRGVGTTLEPAPWGEAWPTGLPGVHRALNPNVQRMLAPATKPQGEPDGRQRQIVEVPPPFRIEITATPSRPVFVPGFAVGLDRIPFGSDPQGSEPVPETVPVTDTTVIPNVPFAPRQRPGPNEKEKKVLARGRAWAIGALRILDAISEAADIVEAVYMSLPKKVRDRAEKRQRAAAGTLDRQQDQLGQYGINGADWRLQAIWDNWRDLDGAQAIGNIVLNEIEDQAYGRAFGARDRLLGRGRNRNNPSRLYRERAK